MKKYNVNVNGTAYEVTVEEVVGGAAPAPVAAPAPAAAPAPLRLRLRPPLRQRRPRRPAVKRSDAPMPGTILSVNVNPGDTVAEGQILMILEAMKMENEIMAPKAGRVVSVSVQKGASVESGTLLCVIG